MNEKRFRQLESVESVGDKTNSKEDKLKNVNFCGRGNGIRKIVIDNY